MKRILCYGDSDTWGYVSGIGTRYDEDTRWPMVAAKLLGREYSVLENGINGRTSAFDSPCLGEYVNGLKGVPYALYAAKPVNLVVIMLGTNDLMHHTIPEALGGLESLVLRFLNAEAVFSSHTKGSSGLYGDGAELLLISPPALGKGLDADANIILRENLSNFGYYTDGVKAIADKFGLPFLDARDFTEPDEADAIHITMASHLRLGAAVAEKVHSLFV